MSSSIFSIEIFIDRIRILEGEKCIFPSTVLKLLDYEPALISTVEHDSQSKFREYIDFIEKSNEVKKITQLNELKDTDGNYVIRKGKSILFDGNTLTLIAEFNALPLYILICDDYFYPNHLIGVVTMKLSDLMINLAKKISTANHTVSEEIMGKFPIVNLMGNAVGFITLKLRLIFIGANLSPHLQEEQHIEIRTRSKVIDPVEKSVEFGDQIITEEIKREEKILVRNIGCQVDKKRTIRIQVPDNNNNIVMNNNLGKVGLTIDPNDPVLVDHPPMIYNSYYGNGEETDSEPEEIKIQPIKTPLENPLSNVVKSLNKSPETIFILNELLTELKTWKSQTDLEKKKPTEEETRKKKSISNRSKIVVEEEEKEEERTERKENRKEFLRRISKPKKRSNSPVGIVPKEKGWLRKEREYSGPIRSRLEYKLTKTQVKRIELRNPTVFKKIIQQKQSKSDRNLSSSDFYTSPSHTPIPRMKRNPLVPPLFGSGTSISVPSFTMSAGTGESQQSEGNEENNKKVHKRPPQSPGKESFHLNNANRNNNNNNNYNSRSFSYDTNETVNEADQYLNLNPVQSNRSPHMSKRSNHVPVESEENSYDYNNRTDYSENSYASESFGNREVDDSDKFNQSYSTENEVAKSPSRRYSVASQISQTSEWRTDYSIESSNSQSNNSKNNNTNKIESSNPSLNHGIQRFPLKVPINPKSSLQSNSVRGPGFSESVESGSYLTPEYERPSFNETLEVSNIDSFNLRHGYNESYNSRQSVDQNDENNSILRPNSVGADVTSFTKVTKYERSLLPGHMNSNYLGTHLITSTVGSLRTDDSQILTSESYY